MNSNALMQNEYEFNLDFRGYVDRYCKTYGKTVEEALKHEIVRQAYLMYTDNQAGENCNLKKAALWKYDRELGIAYFCPDCKRFVCMNGKCKCGADIDLDMPAKKYTGKVKWD